MKESNPASDWTKESEDYSGSAVESLLLEQYRSLLEGLTMLRVSSRAICLVIVGFVVLVNSVHLLQLVASAAVVILVASIWRSEQQSLGVQIGGLEEILARRAGNPWESTYIQSRYFSSVTAGAERLLHVEPFLWSAITIVLAVSRLLFTG
jgi:hypothetical protein